jgi:hypothetical protein
LFLTRFIISPCSPNHKSDTGTNTGTDADAGVGADSSSHFCLNIGDGSAE